MCEKVRKLCTGAYNVGRVIARPFATDENGNFTVDTSVEKTYVITYTIDDFKYRNIKKVRTITIVGGE